MNNRKGIFFPVGVSLKMFQTNGMSTKMLIYSTVCKISPWLTSNTWLWLSFQLEEHAASKVVCHTLWQCDGYSLQSVKIANFIRKNISTPLPLTLFNAYNTLPSRPHTQKRTFTISRILMYTTCCDWRWHYDKRPNIKIQYRWNVSCQQLKTRMIRSYELNSGI